MGYLEHKGGFFGGEYQVFEVVNLGLGRPLPRRQSRYTRRIGDFEVDQGEGKGCKC